jgi:hypothetical protein
VRRLAAGILELALRQVEAELAVHDLVCHAAKPSFGA